MNGLGVSGYSYVALNQFNQPSYVKEIGEVMNKIAKSIIFVATDVDHNYHPNRTRYFVVNNNCCSKLLIWAGFYQQLSYYSINLRDLENIYNLQTHAAGTRAERRAGRGDQARRDRRCRFPVLAGAQHADAARTGSAGRGVRGAALLRNQGRRGGA